MTLNGTMLLKGLLSPEECMALSPPEDISWETTKHADQATNWSHTPEYRLGAQVLSVNPSVQTFLLDFRDTIQANAKAAGIPELQEWGNSLHAKYPLELLGFKRLVLGMKWHRTPANHEIGWHTDDTFGDADEDAGEFGLRALGFMLAINLSEHGGRYEIKLPKGPSDILPIEGIGQGDAVAFCTARDSNGNGWNGSFPDHRFFAEQLATELADSVFRDSLVVYFRDVSARTLKLLWRYWQHNGGVRQNMLGHLGLSSA